jgi:hypothetical protein
VEPLAEGRLEPDAGWPVNYFNYFTEIEERFRQARGTGLFLLSPLDWALIETWKNAGVPLEAVLRGIDEAFEKWRSGKRRTQAVNSLAYCQQAVMLHAERLAGLTAQTASEIKAPFSLEELREFVSSNARHLGGLPAYAEIAGGLRALEAEIDAHYQDLEDLERRLTVLEERMLAIARTAQTGDQQLAARRELDRHLAPYRSRMTAPQLAMLERQFLDRNLFESSGLRRLSLFYLGTL